jgi:His-Xaa-Ser repeat protein HxsA
MKRKIAFAVPSLIAAGLGAPAEVSADEQDFLNDGTIEPSFEIAIDDLHQLQLAQHASHASHGSHQSHGSHRSYYAPPGPAEGEWDERTISSLQETGRNETSTPRSFVLPSTPAIAASTEFPSVPEANRQDLIMRLQLALHTKGYDIGVVTGELHPKTVAAIYRYQIAQGLVPTGKPSPEVFSSLGIIAN